MKRLLPILWLILLIAGNAMAQPLVITNVKAGDFVSKDLLAGKEATTDLTVIGPINYLDLRSIGKTLQGLQRLNLKDANFEKYIGDGWDEYFEANCFPLGIAFHKNIAYLELPASIKRIENSSLDGCKGLRELVVHAATPPEIIYGSLSADNSLFEQCVLYVPATSVDAYKSEGKGWNFKQVKPISENPAPLPLSTLSYTTAKLKQNFSVSVAGGEEVIVKFPDGEVKKATAEAGDAPGTLRFMHSIDQTKVGENPMKVEIFGTTLTAFTSSDNGITTIELANCPKLTRLTLSFEQLTTLNLSAQKGSLKELVLNGNSQLASLDIKDFGKLVRLNVSNSAISELDLKGCTRLTHLFAYNTKVANPLFADCVNLEEIDLTATGLTQIDLSGKERLKTLLLGDNKLTSINLAPTPALSSLNLETNQLTAIVIPSIELTSLNLAGNRLKEIDLSKQTKLAELHLENNLFTLDKLPALSGLSYTYAPQATYSFHDSEFTTNDEIDLSAMAQLKGVLKQPVSSLFVWQRLEGTKKVPLVEGDDYEEVRPGVFRIKKHTLGKVLCQIKTKAFPAFKDKKAYYTETIEVTDVVKPALTFVTDKLSQSFSVTVPVGEEVTVKFPDGVERKGVAQGDGENGVVRFMYTIEENNVGAKPMEVSVLSEKVVAFTASDNGISGVTLLACPQLRRLNVPYNRLTKVDIAPVKNTLEELYLNGNNQMASVDVRHFDKLVWLNVANSAVVELNLEGCSRLAHLIAYNSKVTNPLYADCVDLEEIDLTATGLTHIDLSGKTKLRTLSLADNKLAAIDLAGLMELRSLNLAKNQLTSIAIPSDKLTDLWLEGNQLKEIDLSQQKSLSAAHLEENLFTLDKLPILRGITYTYAPQAPYVFSKSYTTDDEIDLSAMAQLEGGTADKVASTFTWYRREGETLTALAEGSDYQVVRPGVFRIRKHTLGKVLCRVKNPLFPDFVGEKAYCTQEIEIAEGTAIQEPNKEAEVVVLREKDEIVLFSPMVARYTLFDLNGACIASGNAPACSEQRIRMSGTAIVVVECMDQVVVRKL